MGYIEGAHNVKKLNTRRLKPNDELYTLYEQIEQFMGFFHNYLKDKVILLPCDDYTKSNFVKYLIDNAEKIKFKELNATCIGNEYNVASHFRYKNGKTDIKLLDDVEGSYDSQYVSEIAKRCDVIITNPPFSIFGDIYQTFKNKDLILIGTVLKTYNIKCKEDIISKKLKVYALDKKMKFLDIQGNYLSLSNGLIFYNIDGITLKNKTYNMLNMKNCEWLCMEGLDLRIYNNKFSIFVKETKDINLNYKGEMIVPITLLYKYELKYFDILDFYLNREKGEFTKLVIKRNTVELE